MVTFGFNSINKIDGFDRIIWGETARGGFDGFLIIHVRISDGRLIILVIKYLCNVYRLVCER